MLDADERLAPHSGPALRRAIARGGFDCGLVPLHEAKHVNASTAEVLSGKARIGEVNHLPRLLRHTDDLRFTGIIHETILPWLRGRGMATAFVPADIIHLGASLDVRARLAKSERNIRLLERLAEAETDDPTPLGYLAHEYLELGRAHDARHAIARGWSRLASAPPRTSVLRLAVARIRLQLEDGDETGALRSVAEAEAICARAEPVGRGVSRAAPGRAAYRDVPCARSGGGHPLAVGGPGVTRAPGGVGLTSR